jgi:hypothetical protein
LLVNRRFQYWYEACLWSFPQICATVADTPNLYSMPVEGTAADSTKIRVTWHGGKCKLYQEHINSDIKNQDSVIVEDGWS